MTAFSKWKIIAYAAAIFVAGGISGGALGVYEIKAHLFEPREPEMALRLRNRLQTKLGLSPDQMLKINPIVDSAVADIHSIRMETAERINKVFEDSYAQVSAILTPEQRVKLDQMQKERREMVRRAQGRWQEGHRHPGPGGPMHDGPDRDGTPHDSPGPKP
jgi:hypothetical protein